MADYTYTFADAYRNAAADAVLALANGGKIRIRNSATTALVDVTLANPATSGASEGVAALTGPLSGEVLASGTAYDWQLLKSDGTVLVTSTDIGYTGQGRALTIGQVDTLAMTEGHTVSLTVNWAAIPATHTITVA